jgi:hypothetical protein
VPYGDEGSWLCGRLQCVSEHTHTHTPWGCAGLVSAAARPQNCNCERVFCPFRGLLHAACSGLWYYYATSLLWVCGLVQAS